MIAFRGQYAVVKTPAVIPTGFIVTPLRDDYVLLAHPATPVAINDNAVLIGHVFDWSAPEKSAADILADIVKNGATSHLAGRWVLFTDTVMHDACGALGVAWNGQGFASSAKLLSLCVGGIAEIHSPQFEAASEKFCSGLAMLGTLTEYEGVSALLPNYRLRDGTVERYYPVQRHAPLPMAEAVPRITAMLRGIAEAASLRHPLALGVTAGYDSRVLAATVAAVPGLVDDTIFFTFQDYSTFAGHPDITTAKFIVETIGGDHNIVVSSPDVDPAHIAACRASEGQTATRFESWGVAHGQEPLAGRMILSGWCSEIGRAYLRWPNSENAGPEEVLGCSTLQGHDDLLPEANRWHAEARLVQDDHGLPITDLIYWELRVGRWVSANYNIMSVGGDVLPIYSCRDLLDTMLSVSEKQRGYRGSALYKAIIASIEPRLLDKAFVDKAFLPRMKQTVTTTLRTAAIKASLALGIHDVARNAKRAVFGGRWHEASGSRANLGTLLCRIGLHSWRLTDEREFSTGFNVIALRSKDCRRCPAKGAISREVSASNPRPPETAYVPEV